MRLACPRDIGGLGMRHTEPTPRLRPVTFKDWRQVWWQELQSLGHDAALDIRDFGTVRMTRKKWIHAQRIERIYRRLQLETEVADETYREAVIEGIEMMIARGQL